jgi:hypothetical protein
MASKFSLLKKRGERHQKCLTKPWFCETRGEPVDGGVLRGQTSLK